LIEALSFIHNTITDIVLVKSDRVEIFLKFKDMLNFKNHPKKHGSNKHKRNSKGISKTVPSKKTNY